MIEFKKCGGGRKGGKGGHKFDLQLFAEDAAGTDGGLLSSGDTGDKGDAGDADNAGGDNGGGLLSGDGNPDGKDGEKDNPNDTGEHKDDEDNKPSGAPEAYEPFSLPEGLNVKMDDAAVKDFGTLAKGLNLSQQQAQSLVDFQANFVARQQQAMDTATKQQAADWKADTMKSCSKEDISDAVRGFKAAPPEVQQILSACGFDNNKHFVTFFAGIGKSMKEDTFIEGKGGSAAPKSAAKAIYPDLN